MHELLGGEWSKAGIVWRERQEGERILRLGWGGLKKKPAGLPFAR